MEHQARIDAISATYERRGLCAHCHRAVTRQRTFTGQDMSVIEGAADTWTKTPLLHPRCEIAYENALIRQGLS